MTDMQPSCFGHPKWQQDHHHKARLSFGYEKNQFLPYSLTLQFQPYHKHANKIPDVWPMFYNKYWQFLNLPKNVQLFTYIQTLLGSHEALTWCCFCHPCICNHQFPIIHNHKIGKCLAINYITNITNTEIEVFPYQIRGHVHLTVPILVQILFVSLLMNWHISI